MLDPAFAKLIVLVKGSDDTDVELISCNPSSSLILESPTIS